MILVGSVVSGLGAAEYPTAGVMPKAETGALRFLEQHPEFDGRGVVVAILDTGVDPGAIGLQRTTDGKPKVIGMIDATGSGDVRTDTVVTVGDDGTLEGLSGRALRPGGDWNVRDGEYRLGVKPAFEIYPSELVARMKAERLRDWKAAQRDAVNVARAEIEKWKAEHPSPGKEDEEELADLEGRLKQLQKLGEGYEDPGPIFDCVVFHDGEHWRAAIDSDEDGDLADESLLTDYATEFGFGTFQDGSLMNYAVNIYEGGDVLSIVADAGMHGTHVAGIVAANYPDDPAMNGVAPGAQIVSIKIGDTRIDGMETGTAVSRAAIAIRQFGCHMANMSYGEPTRTPDAGPVVEALSELAHEHDVVFVSSAGNSGPALSTVGAPGATTSGIIGVGASVTPDLMRSAYAMREILPATQFTWSSRGPAQDGSLGVSISAPGGAISPVPRWELQRNLRANGTSMASPNACGGIALILSGLLAEQKGWRADGVRRAVEATADPVPGVEVFAQGHGMLQVDRAFEVLLEQGEREFELPRFTVSVGDGARGVYLREPEDVAGVREIGVSVKPAWREDEDRELMADFQVRVRMESTAPWVVAPEFAFLANGARSFDIEVDPKKAGAGAHFAEVLGFDADVESDVPLFRVPVTVLNASERIDDGGGWERTLKLGPGGIERMFFDVPPGATWAKVEIRADANDRTRRLMVHAQQLVPGSNYRNEGALSFVSADATPGAEPWTSTVPVLGGRSLELCVAHYWSVVGTGTFEITVQFHGLADEGGSPVITQGDRLGGLRLAAAVAPVRFTPSASFTMLRRSLAADKAEITTLVGARDRLEDGEVFHQLVLSYPFELGDKSEVRAVVPALNDRLYEAGFEGQLYLWFDGNKRYLGADDTFPGFIKLGEGKHVVRLQLRHRDRSALEGMKNLGVVLESKLAKAITAKVFRSADAALGANGGAGAIRLAPGGRVHLFVAEPKAPASAKAGDLLVGSLAAGKSTAVPITYVHHGRSFVEKDEKEKEAGEEEEPSLKDDRFEVLLGLLNSYAKKKEFERFSKLAKGMLKAHPDNVELRGAVLARHAGETDAGELADPPAVIAAADAVIGLIDTDALALYFGRLHDTGSDAGKQAAKEMAAARETLVDALAAKVRALADSEAEVARFKAALDELEAWIDLDEEKDRFVLRLAIARRQGDLGAQLALLDGRVASGKASRADYEARIALFGDLGWNHLVESEERWMIRRFRDHYLPF